VWHLLEASHTFLPVADVVLIDACLADEEANAGTS